VDYALVTSEKKDLVADALKLMMLINQMCAEVVQLLTVSIWLKLHQDFVMIVKNIHVPD
jgi:hypothetical protein